MINVNVNFCYSDMYMEWLLAIAFVGGIAAPLNYRWVSPHSSLVYFIHIKYVFNYLIIILMLLLRVDPDFLVGSNALRFLTL